MLHILKNVVLSLSDSIKNIARALFASFGILFIISFLVLYLSFRDSVKSYIESNLFGKLAINEIKIYPKKTSSNNLFTTASSINASIDIDKIKKIRRMKDFSRTFSIVRFDYDTRVKGELMGHRMRILIPVFGVQKQLFEGNNPYWKSFTNTRPLPVIAPRFSYEVLNNMLITQGLPVMTPENFRGFPLELHIYTRDTSGRRIRNHTECEAHSFTDLLNLPGVIVPTDYIVEISKKHQNDSGAFKKGYKYVMMIARVKDIKKLPEITTQLHNIGLDVESRDDIAKKTNQVLEIIDKSSIVIIAILLILTVISVFNAYLTIVYIRAQQFSLKRVLGVSKLRIVFSFVLEAALIGALYGLAGFFLGSWLVSYLKVNLGKWIPALANIIIQGTDASILVMAIGLSAAISALSASIPAVFASNINLFKAMKK